MFYFKDLSNSKDFYNGLFLHVKPVCIIFPYFHSMVLKSGPKFFGQKFNNFVILQTAKT